MTKTDSICYTQDLPKVIQNVLFEHGEKKPIVRQGWLLLTWCAFVLP